MIDWALDWFISLGAAGVIVAVFVGIVAIASYWLFIAPDHPEEDKDDHDPYGDSW